MNETDILRTDAVISFIAVVVQTSIAVSLGSNLHFSLMTVFRNVRYICCLLWNPSTRAMLWFWQFFFALIPLRRWFNPRPIYVGFVVDKVALGQVLL
jgi:hypothetical protein